MVQVKSILDPKLHLFYIFVKSFLRTSILSTNILISEKLLVQILNWYIKNSKNLQ